MSANRDTVDTVERLLNERRKVAGWLSALESRRASTAAAVFQKVHDDYASKLDKVQGKLVAASDAVQAAADELGASLAEREQAVDLKRDERAEAELRAAVGEYSEKEWEKRRVKLDEELAAATTQRDTVRAELERLRSVLTEVRSSDLTFRVGADDAAAATEPSVPKGESTAEVGADAPSPIEPPAPGESAGHVIPIHEQSVIAPVEPTQPLAPSFDELAFLKSVVGRPSPAAMKVAIEPPPTAPTPPAVEAPRDSKAAYTLPEPPMPFPDPMPEPRVSQEMTPPRESFFGRPTPRTSEAVKSLRCQECGTLNFPTEWYCERCGGELAAM